MVLEYSSSDMVRTVWGGYGGRDRDPGDTRSAGRGIAPGIGTAARTVGNGGGGIFSRYRTAPITPARILTSPGSGKREGRRGLDVSNAKAGRTTSVAKKALNLRFSMEKDKTPGN